MSRTEEDSMTNTAAENLPTKWFALHFHTTEGYFGGWIFKSLEDALVTSDRIIRYTGRVEIREIEYGEAHKWGAGMQACKDPNAGRLVWTRENKTEADMKSEWRTRRTMQRLARREAESNAAE
jgi:hypothetical protein